MADDKRDILNEGESWLATILQLAGVLVLLASIVSAVVLLNEPSWPKKSHSITQYVLTGAGLSFGVFSLVMAGVIVRLDQLVQNSENLKWLDPKVMAQFRVTVAQHKAEKERLAQQQPPAGKQ